MSEAEAPKVAIEEKPNVSKSASPATAAIRKYLYIGLFLSVMLIFGFGGWAAVANLSGAVLASGNVVVAGNVKRIQHREGGIIGNILVKNGDRIDAGDLLIRLDDTQTRAGLSILERQIEELKVRQLRLQSERDNIDYFLTRTLFEQPTSLQQQLINSQHALFEARKTSLEGQKKLLLERINQTAKEVEGLEARIEAKEEELALVTEELAGIEELHRKGLVPFPRVTELRRRRALVAGERGQFIADNARAQARMSEVGLQILQLDKDQLSEVLTEIRDVEARLSELEERRIAAADQLNRIEIRAPIGGIVHELAVHTEGGVVGAGETVLSIVPDQDALMVEVQVLPTDIDQVFVGQTSALRLSAFSQTTTPEIFGTVRTKSADLSQNPQTGESWYTARISINDEELPKIEHIDLVPGMPVEAFIKTQDRTALSYLVKPITDQFNRALIEE